MWSTTLLNVTEREQHGRHSCLAEHGEPHAAHLRVEAADTGRTFTGDRGGQQPPARRLELGHGVVVHAGAAFGCGLEADVDVGREPVGSCAWTAASGSSEDATVALRSRRACTNRRESELRPPNCPTTTRRSVSERVVDVSASSSRRVETPGPLPVWRRRICRARTVIGPHTPSMRRPELRWKSSTRARCPGSEDAVDATTVEPEPAERRLQVGDVVAAQVRGDEHEQPVTELPRRLDQRRPRLVVARARGACRPRFSWKSRNAASVAAPNTPASAPAGWNPAAPRRR